MRNPRITNTHTDQSNCMIVHLLLKLAIIILATWIHSVQYWVPNIGLMIHWVTNGDLLWLISPCASWRLSGSGCVSTLIGHMAAKLRWGYTSQSDTHNLQKDSVWRITGIFRLLLSKTELSAALTPFLFSKTGNINRQKSTPGNFQQA